MIWGSCGPVAEVRAVGNELWATASLAMVYNVVPA